MNRRNSYTGLDCFRFFAALLVIANHSSPLASFSETGDFILTRVIARLAVPFFFMTSGFFLISRYSRNAEKLISFIKKTALIYLAAILIYIPINIYNGYFSMTQLAPNLIKDIVFDGTLYHLWYLPASIFGAIIAWFAIKKLGYPRAILITIALYLIGLFGDSYYGIAKNISTLHSFYDFLFQIMDYTRNGIFFAPIFFVFGAMIADKPKQMPLGKAVLGFIASASLMLGEAMLLHQYDLQRHDSMYIFLLPCMYFLFSMLIHWQGRQVAWLRTTSLLIYIIHPMMIVVIRLFDKLLGLQGILIQNSLVNYTLVSLASILFSLIVTFFWSKFKPKRMQNNDRAWIELDLNHLTHNVKSIQAAMPSDCDMMAVVKAEAYGHSAFEISKHLNQIGIRSFAVATMDEGIQLRKYGIQGQILILGYTDVQRAAELKKYELTQSLIDYEYAKALHNQRCNVKVHMKIDTGMHRLGFTSDDIDAILEVFNFKYLKVSGIFTHLCAADSLEEADVEYSNKQISAFYEVLDQLKENGITLPKTHIQSSYGLLNYPELRCNYVRMGIALYGVLSHPNRKTKLDLDLRPVLSLKSKVILIRKIKSGESVGYGRSFVAESDSTIAIIPIGYADGYPRNLSCEKAEVLIRNTRAPIIGRICMDQMVIDVTDIPDIVIGDVVTLIGASETHQIDASQLAADAESITNELLSRLGARLQIGSW